MAEKGLKFDGEKLLMNLIPPEAINALGEVFTYGAKKYTPEGWKTVPNAKDRYYSALMRHLMAYKLGEQNDPESGLHHLKHVMTNAAILLHFEEEDKKQLKLDLNG